MTDTADWSNVVNPGVRVVGSGTAPANQQTVTNLALQATDRAVVLLIKAFQNSTGFTLTGNTSGSVYLTTSGSELPPDGVVKVPAYGAADPVVALAINAQAVPVPWVALAVPDDSLEGFTGTPKAVVDSASFESSGSGLITMTTAGQVIVPAPPSGAVRKVTNIYCEGASGNLVAQFTIGGIVVARGQVNVTSGLSYSVFPGPFYLKANSLNGVTGGNACNVCAAFVDH